MRTQYSRVVRGDEDRRPATSEPSQAGRRPHRSQDPQVEPRSSTAAVPRHGGPVLRHCFSTGAAQRGRFRDSDPGPSTLLNLRANPRMEQSRNLTVLGRFLRSSHPDGDAESLTRKELTPVTHREGDLGASTWWGGHPALPTRRKARSVRACCVHLEPRACPRVRGRDALAPRALASSIIIQISMGYEICSIRGDGLVPSRRALTGALAVATQLHQTLRRVRRGRTSPSPTATGGLPPQRSCSRRALGSLGPVFGSASGTRRGTPRLAGTVRDMRRARRGCALGP